MAGSLSAVPPPEQAAIKTVAASAAALSQAATGSRTAGIERSLISFKLSHVPMWACISPDRMLPNNVGQAPWRLLQESPRCANANADPGSTRGEPMPRLGTQTAADFRREEPLDYGLYSASDGRSSARSQKSRGLTAIPYQKDVIAQGVSTSAHRIRSPPYSRPTLPARATLKPRTRIRPITPLPSSEATAGWQRVNRTPRRVVTGCWH